MMTLTPEIAREMTQKAVEAHKREMEKRALEFINEKCAIVIEERANRGFSDARIGCPNETNAFTDLVVEILKQVGWGATKMLAKDYEIKIEW